MIKVNERYIVGGTFPNKEKFYNHVNEFGADRFVFEVVFESNEDLFDTLLYKKYIDDVFPIAHTTLCIHFCPYGQSDREFEDKIFTFKYMAQLINDANFTTVVIRDPHSPVMAAALARCWVQYPILSDNYDLYFYPDNGAAKKYSEIYDHPYRFGNKKRNLDTGQIICYEAIADKSEIEGKKILIVDDLCMGGRTFKEAAKVLHEMGAAQIDLHITHLMPQAEEFYKNHKDFYIDNFYSSNTLKQPWYIGRDWNEETDSN